MLGRVAKIPIASNYNELAEMEFADRGDYASLFSHSRHFFSRFPVIVFFVGNKENVGTTAEIAKGCAIPDRISIFGTPGILMADKDS